MIRYLSVCVCAVPAPNNKPYCLYACIQFIFILPQRSPQVRNLVFFISTYHDNSAFHGIIFSSALCLLWWWHHYEKCASARHATTTTKNQKKRVGHPSWVITIEQFVMMMTTMMILCVLRIINANVPYISQENEITVALYFFNIIIIRVILIDWEVRRMIEKLEKIPQEKWLV